MTPRPLLELFQKFIRFGSGTLPLSSFLNLLIPDHPTLYNHHYHNYDHHYSYCLTNNQPAKEFSVEDVITDNSPWNPWINLPKKWFKIHFFCSCATDVLFLGVADSTFYFICLTHGSMPRMNSAALSDKIQLAICWLQPPLPPTVHNYCAVCYPTIRECVTYKLK